MSEPTPEPELTPEEQELERELEETGRESSTPLVALLAAIVLGLAAILTAWGSFQAARTGGDVVKAYAEQQALIATANDIYAQSDQASSLEQQFFLTYAINLSEDNQGAVDYLYETMSPELDAAVDWWVDSPTATSPFLPENPAYADLPSQVLLADGIATMDAADAKRVEAEASDAVGNRFGLANVFFAVVLFLAGIATLLSRRPLQMGVLVLSMATLAVGVVILVTTTGWATLG